MSFHALGVPRLFSTFADSPLTNVTDLAEEGKAMQHCVAGYAMPCDFDGHHILSLRTAAGPLSTAETSRVGPGAGLHVLQSVLNTALIEAFAVWRPHIRRPWSTLTQPEFAGEVCRHILPAGLGQGKRDT